MSTFQVDPIEIAVAVKSARAISPEITNIALRFTELGPAAPAFGDPTCSSQFVGFLAQWGTELTAFVIDLENHLESLVLSNNEYVAVEAAISDTPVEYIPWDSL